MRAEVPHAKSVEAVVAAWPRRLSQPVNHPTTATCFFGARYYSSIYCAFGNCLTLTVKYRPPEVYRLVTWGKGKEQDMRRLVPLHWRQCTYTKPLQQTYIINQSASLHGIVPTPNSGGRSPRCQWKLESRRHLPPSVILPCKLVVP